VVQHGKAQLSNLRMKAYQTQFLPYSHNVLLATDMWGFSSKCAVLQIQQGTSAEYSLINSDIIYQEMGRSYRMKAQPHTTAPTSDANQTPGHLTDASDQPV
jgi:hypothetical protein